MSAQNPFTTLFEPVPGTGAEVALHPWDEEVFGFRSGELRLGEGSSAAEPLARWMGGRSVALLVSQAPGDDPAARGRLMDLGFRPVEESYTVALPRLARVELPDTPHRLRRALPEERPALEDLARRAFRFGRFHTDPLFPAELAAARMARWVGRAFESPDPADAVLTLEGEGRPAGFFHVRTVERRSSLRLGAVDPEQNTGLGGHGLFVETLRWLRQEGARAVTAEIAAANTGVVNIYARLGFHFTGLEVTMHLHSPEAPYLRP